jgi:hypothetical protein
MAKPPTNEWGTAVDLVEGAAQLCINSALDERP